MLLISGKKMLMSVKLKMSRDSYKFGSSLGKI